MSEIEKSEQKTLSAQEADVSHNPQSAIHNPQSRSIARSAGIVGVAVMAVPPFSWSFSGNAPRVLPAPGAADSLSILAFSAAI